MEQIFGDTKKRVEVIGLRKVTEVVMSLLPFSLQDLSAWMQCSQDLEQGTQHVSSRRNTWILQEEQEWILLSLRE